MTIRVRLLYFGQARDASGTGEEEFALPDGSSVKVLLGESSAAHAKIGTMRRSMQIAVNEEIAEPGRLLKDGDVVAFLPPVAGG
jgi:molybdopterin converting factor subunit 1